MGNILMDIQLDEPTIEFEMPKLKEDNKEQLNNISQEPFMVIDVPEPIIEFPSKRRDEDEELYEDYLEYIYYLLNKYGDGWRRSLTTDELSDYITYYSTLHDVSEEDILNEFSEQKLNTSMKI